MTERVRILLIDDDQVDRAFVRRALGKAGIDFDLVEASSGTEGLARSQEQSFDCVLLDYRLPDLDALDLLTDLLKRGPQGNAVIILTGELDPNAALRMMRAGALDFLAKSEVTPSSLARSIRHARAKREFLSELESARKVAEEKTRELQILNDQKDLLFSIIAHDLRNPFQALLGLSELQRRAAAKQDWAAMTRHTEGIHVSAARAASLMEGLFAWASLQLTSPELVMSDVDIKAVVDEMLSTVADPVAKKQLRVRNDCAGVVAGGDPGMIATVLRNLVNNAIKFTAPGGEIRVSARTADDAVQVAVSDTGIGIPAETAANLFRMDRRATRPGTDGEPGSGLGLLICQTLVERLGGVLSLDTAPGSGTTFRFTLPKPTGSPPSPDQAAALAH
jgi:two-component system sensor histidine kinase/response regulator